MKDNDMEQIIKEFRGQYAFLSNFYSSPIMFDHQTFSTAEHLYQALKAKTQEDYMFVCQAFSPGDAKKRGAQIELRPDWEDVKDRLMKLVLILKFTQHTDLTTLLKDTDGYILQEGNMWGDKYWGVCLKTNEGQNRLGILLREVREFIL